MSFEVFYIHRREAERPIEEVMETLATFKKEGKIHGIGFSEIAPNSLREASGRSRSCAISTVSR